jgi:hypothetical protein
MLEAFYDWVAARSPKYRRMGNERREMEHKIQELEYRLLEEKQRRLDCMTDIAWLQAEIQKVNVPLSTLREATARTYPGPYAYQELLRVEYPLDTMLVQILPVPLLIQKIAEAMTEAALGALAKRFQISDGVRRSLLPASGKAGGQ